MSDAPQQSGAVDGLLTSLLVAAPEPMFVQDRQGRILFWNRGAATLYGWSEQEACGRASHEFLQTNYPLPLDQILALSDQGCWQGRLIRRARDGRQITVASRWSCPPGSAAVLVMEKEAAEQALASPALRDKEPDSRTLAAVLDMLPGYAILIDADHKLRFVSQGYPQLFARAKDPRCYEVRFGREQPCEDCPARRVLASGRPEDWEESLGDGRTYHVWAYPFTDAQGEAQVLQLGLDVTERRKLEAMLSEASEKVRRATGKHLHDALGQTLAGLSYLVQGLADKLGDRLVEERATLDAILKAANDAVRQVRVLARGLDPVGLDDLGLHAAMEGLVQNASSWHGLDARLEWTCHSRVRPGAATHLYYIVQEALNNVAKHAQARRVVVSLHENAQYLVLQICDDGKGMPPGGRKAGLGMQVMNYRASAVGGRLFYTAGEPGGTVVTCKVPKAGVLAGEGEET